MDRLTSGRLKLDDVNQGFDRLHECKAVRQVVVLLEERRAMKVTVEIDCTPIEARKFFGLPNVEPMQAAMMAKIEQRLAQEIDRFSPDSLMRSWLSVFPQNAETLQKIFASMMGQGKPG